MLAFSLFFAKIVIYFQFSYVYFVIFIYIIKSVENQVYNKDVLYKIIYLSFTYYSVQICRAVILPSKTLIPRFATIALQIRIPTENSTKQNLTNEISYL